MALWTHKTQGAHRATPQGRCNAQAPALWTVSGTVGNITKSVSLQDFITPADNNASDLIIEGESKETSVIEGQGSDWWRLRDEKAAAWNYIKRGAVIRFTTSAQRFLVRNLRIQNAPGVNIAAGKSGKGSNCTIHDVVIREPDSTLPFRPAENSFPSHNTDGIPYGPTM